MKLDVYTRVSHKADKRQLSTSGQEEACRARIELVGAQVGAVFTDPGRSAWNPRVHRPAWEALMARLENREADGVCVFDLPRFARRPADGERLITAAEHGLLVLDAGSAYDLTSASGKKAFRDAMAAAAYYSDMISESVRRGKQLKAQQGEVDKRRSFGFEPDGITLNPREVQVLRDCARRLLAGETQQAIIRDLNDRGVPAVRGALWGYTTFRQLLTRPRTAGLIAHNGTVVGSLPAAILDQQTYDRIVALYTARRPGRPPSGRYLLSGLARCACGARLGGRPVSGTQRRQYWCRRCRKISVTVARLDEHVLDWAVRTLSDPAHAEAQAQAEAENAARREQLTTEQAAIEATLIELAGRLGRQELSLARHDAAARPLEARQAELARELDELAQGSRGEPRGRTLATADPQGHAWVGWLEVATSGTVAERRAMVIRALAGRRITVGPGRSARFDPERVSIR